MNAKNAQNVSVKSSEGKSKKSSGLPSGQLLDSLGAFDGHNQYSYELREIMDARSLEPTMDTFQILATALSNLARQDPPWTKKYIHSIYHERLYPSPVLARAINKLAQTIDGTPESIAGSEYKRVLAPAEMPDDVIIPPNAKWPHCKLPRCSAEFIRCSNRQEFCCPSHQKEFAKIIKESEKQK